MYPCIAALGVYYPIPKKKGMLYYVLHLYDLSPRIADPYVIIGNTRALYSLVKHE